MRHLLFHSFLPSLFINPRPISCNPFSCHYVFSSLIFYFLSSLISFFPHSFSSFLPLYPFSFLSSRHLIILPKIYVKLSLLWVFLSPTGVKRGEWGGGRRRIWKVNAWLNVLSRLQTEFIVSLTPKDPNIREIETPVCTITNRLQ